MLFNKERQSSTRWLRHLNKITDSFAAIKYADMKSLMNFEIPSSEEKELTA